MKYIDQPTEHADSELAQHVATIWRRRWSVLAILVVFVMGLLFYSYRQNPIYESRSRVLLRPLAGETETDIQTEREVATSAAVGELAARELVTVSVGELLAGLRVVAAPETDVLVMSYQHGSPAEAQRRMRSLAEALLKHRQSAAVEALLAALEPVNREIDFLEREIQQVNRDIATTDSVEERLQLETERNTMTSQLALLEQQQRTLTPPQEIRIGEVIEPATLPTTPVSPNHTQAAILGMFFGLLAAVVYALLAERLDTRIRSRFGLAGALGKPVLGVIPTVPGWGKRRTSRLVALDRPKSAAAEAYRSLRASFLFALLQNKAKIIMVTSPNAGEGKSVTSANLGITLAQAGKVVVLISADLRRPSLDPMFKLDGRKGLADALSKGLHDPAEFLYETPLQDLWVVPAGSTPGNPTELLRSQAMGDLLAELKRVADIVILDSPPVLGVADTLELVPLVDSAVVVVDAQKATHGSIQHAMHDLDQLRAPIMGAVLNNLDPSKGGYYYNYARAYDAYIVQDRSSDFSSIVPFLKRRSGAGAPSINEEAPPGSSGTTPPSA